MNAPTVPNRPAEPAAVVELSPSDLPAVAGGLNPQPLPPRYIR